MNYILSARPLTLAKRKTLFCAKKWSSNPFRLSCYKMLWCWAPYIRFLFPPYTQNDVDMKKSYFTRFHRGCTHYVLYLLHPAADSSNLVSSQTNHQTVKIFFPVDFSGCSRTIMTKLKGSAFISLLALLPSFAGVPTYV